MSETGENVDKDAEYIMARYCTAADTLEDAP